MVKRERCKDIVGKKVRLLRDMETRGGATFAAGTVMTCQGTYHGLFHLADLEWQPPEDATSWSRPCIRKVDRRSFEVLPECQTQMVDCSKEGT